MGVSNRKAYRFKHVLFFLLWFIRTIRRKSENFPIQVLYSAIEIQIALHWIALLLPSQRENVVSSEAIILITLESVLSYNNYF